MSDLCPHCKMPFADRKTTACPVCGNLYHTTCWLERGRCVTPGCPGGEHARVQQGEGQTPPPPAPEPSYSPPPPPPQQYAPYPPYGNPYGQANTYGAPYDTGLQPEEFIFKRREVYAYKFARVRAGAKPWNWAAFLFGAFWFFYRRMYAIGIALVLGEILLNLLTNLFLPAAIGNLLGFIVMILLGIFGDKLYFKHLQKIINEAPPQLSGQARQNYALHRGGESAGAVWLVILIQFAVSFLVLNIFMQDFMEQFQNYFNTYPPTQW